MKVLAVIPARWGSSRFPGKVLTNIAGKPMIRWPYEAATDCSAIDHVIVATEDERVERACEHWGMSWMRTDKAHRCGTERVAEVADRLKIKGSRADLVINLQADEVLITPVHLAKLVTAMWHAACRIATLARVAPRSRMLSPARVKVVVDSSGRALYFSRAVIPAGASECLEHIGVYGFSLGALMELPGCQGKLEEAEELEQLRWLEAGRSVWVMQIAESRWVSVNVIEDVPIAESVLMQRGK